VRKHALRTIVVNPIFHIYEKETEQKIARVNMPLNSINFTKKYSPPHLNLTSDILVEATASVLDQIKHRLRVF
jgi:hypothetical protein